MLQPMSESRSKLFEAQTELGFCTKLLLSKGVDILDMVLTEGREARSLESAASIS